MGQDRQNFPNKGVDWVEVNAEEGIDEAEARLAGMAFIETEPPAIGNLGDLPTTLFERMAVESTVEGLNKLRERADEPRVALPAERLHIVPDDVFADRFGSVQGFEQYGHIYLPKAVRYDEDLWPLSLVHELVHATGFLCMRLDMVLKENGKVGYSAFLRRSGLMHVRDDEDAECRGLNEVVTEYQALLVRSLLAANDDDFGRSCRKYENAVVSYIDHFHFYMELFRQLAEAGVNDWEEPTDVWATLIVDYLSGRNVFMDAVEGANPELHAAIRGLDVQEEDFDWLRENTGRKWTFGS